LMAGELTLFEAAALFAQANEAHPECAGFHRLHQGSSDGEKLCREVISWVSTKTEYEQSTAAADKLRERMEVELQEQLDCYGAVVLPK
jgi:hypothetical protein